MCVCVCVCVCGGGGGGGGGGCMHTYAEGQQVYVTSGMLEHCGRAGAS